MNDLSQRLPYLLFGWTKILWRVDPVIRISGGGGERYPAIPNGATVLQDTVDSAVVDSAVVDSTVGAVVAAVAEKAAVSRAGKCAAQIFGLPAVRSMTQKN